MIAQELTARNDHGTRGFVIAVAIVVTIAGGSRLPCGNSSR